MTVDVHTEVDIERPVTEVAAQRSRSGIDVYRDPARFVAPKVLEVGGQTMTAEQIVVAAGSRPDVPAVPGLVARHGHGARRAER